LLLFEDERRRRAHHKEMGKMGGHTNSPLMVFFAELPKNFPEFPGNLRRIFPFCCASLGICKLIFIAFTHPQQQQQTRMGFAFSV
jgi:hypothetical protein